MWERSEPELASSEARVSFAGHLRLGAPNTDGAKVGPGYEPKTPQDVEKAASALAEFTQPVTIGSTAFCIDERALTDCGGITDRDQLATLVAHRLPGGLFLAVTQAAVAADAVIVRGAKNLQDAYALVGNELQWQGFEDAGHEGCKASEVAAEVTANQVDPEVAFLVAAGQGWANTRDRQAFLRIANTKHALTDQGFYGSWTPEWHQQQINTRAPRNFAQLNVQDDPTKGHHASGLYVITQPGMGLAGNHCRQAAGLDFFVYTAPFATQMASLIGGSPEEQRRIELALHYNLFDIANTLVAEPSPDFPGMAVFADRAYQI